MSEGNEKKEVEKEVEDGGAEEKPNEAEVATGDEKNVESGAAVITDATGEVGEERKPEDSGLKPNVESEDVKEVAKVDGDDAAPEKKVEAASSEIIGSGDCNDGIKVDGDDVACGSEAGLEKSEAGEVKLEIDERNGAEKQPNPENVTENVKKERNVEAGDGAHGNTPEKENVEMTNGEVKENTAQVENAKDGGTVNVKEELALVSVQTEDGETRADTRAKEVQSGDGQLQGTPLKLQTVACEHPVSADVSNQSYIWDTQSYEGDGAGTEEEQAAFMRELETFHKEKNLEFKPPKFYGEGLNCLKLWRAVTRLGGYDQVTSCKLWRQVGESFNPPRTCTTVSWSFRCFYEKALLEYEKHKIRIGELPIPLASSEPISIDNQTKGSQAPGSGRTIRDAAARAMQGWHSQRLLGNGEVGDPIIKDKNSISLLKRDKQLKNVGLFKRKKTSPIERSAKVARTKPTDQQTDAMVVDVGPPADWVKINVRRTKDCFEIYALVPGLLREEVHVQSDPAGRLVISGEPEQIDNPWGVTPFKKVVTLPSRIDPHQTSAVVTLHGQLFVRAPFEQDNMLVGV